MAVKVRINGILIAYTDQGKGTPILFVHGFPMSMAVWEPQVKALSSSFRVICLDLRGHGESGAPQGHSTMETFADDVRGLLDYLAIERAVLAGLSMGGYTLFAFYRKYPTRVKGLVLADTRAGSDTPEVRDGRFKMVQTADQEGLDSVAQAMIPKLLCPASVKGRADLVENVRHIIVHNALTGVVGDLHAMAGRPDSVDLLSKISCPTLVLVGEQDTATPPSEVKQMADQIKAARFEIIPSAGHLSNLENPVAFNQAVRRFVKSL
jgi:3-oxoadipate enol-lactonase